MLMEDIYFISSTYLAFSLLLFLKLVVLITQNMKNISLNQLNNAAATHHVFVSYMLMQIFETDLTIGCCDHSLLIF